MAIREINLVPSNMVHRLHVKRHLVFWLFGLLLVVAPVFGFHFHYLRTVLARQEAYSLIQDIDGRLVQTLNEIKRIQEEVTALNQQQADLIAVIRPPAYTLALHHLVRALNEETWLVSLQIRRGKVSTDPVLLQVAGFTASNNALGNFLNRLSGDPATESVQLQYAREAKEKSAGASKNAAAAVEFGLECRMKLG